MGLLLWTLLACKEPTPGGKHQETETTTVPACEEGLVEDSVGDCVPVGCEAIPPGDVYVLAGGDGDGSAGAPFGTVAEGVDHGGMVAVGLGTYEEVLLLDEAHHGVQIVGRCREGVTLESAEGDPAITLEGDRDTVVAVSDMAIRGGGVAATGGLLTLDQVDIENAVAIGILAEGRNAAVTLVDVTVSDTSSEGGEGDRKSVV